CHTDIRLFVRNPSLHAAIRANDMVQVKIHYGYGLESREDGLSPLYTALKSNASTEMMCVLKINGASAYPATPEEVALLKEVKHNKAWARCLQTIRNMSLEADRILKE